MSDTNYPHTNDEIDLFQLVENLWKEKWLIVATTTVCVAIAAIFAFTTPPVYVAKVDLKQPSPAQLSQINTLPLYDKLSVTPMDDLLQLINASDLRMAFINAAPEEAQSIYPQKVQANYELLAQNAFTGMFAYQRNDGGKNKTALFPWTLTFKSSDRLLAASELDRLIEFSSQALLKHYRGDYNTVRNNEIERLLSAIDYLEQQAQQQREYKIQRIEEQHLQQKLQLEDKLRAAKETYQKQLNDKIYSLKEAINIASALGIKKPVQLADLNENSRRVEIGLNASGQPLYLRGSTLLSVELEQLETRPADYFPDASIRTIEERLLSLQNNREIELLKARKSDKAFIPELEGLQARLDKIRAEEFPSDLSLEFRNSPAMAESAPIKPKKSLILALSVVLGGMIGVITALIRCAIRNRKLRTRL
ncbi:Wzz/FepE/Etk N-terminal domain-containing protein [Neptuniibacter halophilus]|uniref:Wzz/FepE/Etk N-terminal domain-containing protein n=1 Tax=Neptuniibacter halophilus TaxID=651666 RepID=UPI0025737E02|nr:Wzz/FepE/Etk N-terminal domain-containing protein [Neptuniibacter halophilus]